MPPNAPYTEHQLDALRELANIGSGTAGTALSSLLGRGVDLAVPRALALPVADAVDAVGPAEGVVWAVLLPIVSEIEAIVLLAFTPQDAATLCGMLGVDPDDEVGRSALGEIGNILGASYVGALSAMTGLTMEPRPPQTVKDMLGAIVASAVVAGSGGAELALVLDSDLRVEQESCSLTFLLLPTAGGVAELLSRLGM